MLMNLATNAANVNKQKIIKKAVSKQFFLGQLVLESIFTWQYKRIAFNK